MSLHSRSHRPSAAPCAVSEASKPQSSVLELVCPAGSLPALKAAVDHGANTVYLGFRDATNARNFAGLNFDAAAIANGIRYAHERGCKVLLALNTYPQASKVQVWQHAIDQAATLGVDAVILADPGLMAYARTTHPQLRLHLSVQASATHAAAIKLYHEQFGIARAVLPRVLSLEQVKQLAARLDPNAGVRAALASRGAVADLAQTSSLACDQRLATRANEGTPIRHLDQGAPQGKTPVEIEVFGFGSLCVMAEGRCALSSYATGEAPNTHGVCSPPKAVRWQETPKGLEVRLNGVLIDRYAAGQNAGYPTLCKGRFDVGDVRDDGYYAIEEPTSLNTLELLPELMRIGVKAIKIEGRQRSPAYVAQVTKVWRQAIDTCAADPDAYTAQPAWMAALAQVAEGQQQTLGAYNRPWK